MNNANTFLQEFPHCINRQSIALLQHIHPRCYLFAAWDATEEQFLNGYFFQREAGGLGLLIDPPFHDEYLAAAYDALGGVAAVYCSGARQTLACQEIATALGVTTYTHEDPEKLEAFGLKYLALEHQSTPQEGVLFSAESGTLFSGFTLTAPSCGSIGLHPEHRYLNPAWVLEGLRPLQGIMGEVRSIMPSLGEALLEHEGASALILGLFQ